MEFNQTFFEDEVREGFFVSSAMKHSWAAQLEVLEEVANVCQRHSIEWFVDFGSLLGAIRHGGFIPWDDDLDISMTRPNFERFLEVARDELPSYFTILNVRFNPDYEEMFTRISCGRGIDFSPWRLEKYHDSPLSDGIDIFVLDYVPKNPEQARLQQELAAKVEGLFTELHSSEYVTEEIATHIAEVQAMTGVSFDNRPILQQVHMLLDNIYRLFSYDDADKIAHMYHYFHYSGHRHIYPKEAYDNIIWVPFEHIELPVPIGYNAILEIEFPGYMNIYKGGSKHNYPLYSIQEEFMLYKFPDKRIDYIFDENDLVRPAIASDDYINNAQGILMLISHPKHWEALLPIYNKLVSDNETVTILLISYYIKDVNNKFGEMHLDTESMPNGLNYVIDADYSLGSKIYSSIYTVDGIDECGRNYAVGDQFQVKELLKHSPSVTYVSPYMIDDFDASDEVSGYSLRFLAGIPGVIRADHTIVPSECIRDRFIEYLTHISDSRYKKTWEEKIIASHP